MARASRRCQYKSYWDPAYQCRHRIERDALCIFHIPKLSSDEKRALPPEEFAVVNETEKKFQREFMLFLRRSEADPDIAFCDFIGFSFPSVNLAGITFNKQANFLGASFHGQATFEGAIFSQGADFGRATVYEEAKFDKAEFGEVNRFLNAIFKQEVTFRKAVLTQADFSSVTFDQAVDFSQATFKDGCLFSRAIFNQLADFSDAIFFNARFFRAHFKQTAIFSQTTFNEGVDFLGTNFSKDAYFVGDNIHKCFEERCSFKGIKLDKDAELVFERVCLERATFLDANLERITFRDVDWHRASSRWMTRKQALSDEFEMLNGDELNKSIYEKISENYSQLVLNYEKRRDYNSAENFHIGEMELLRKKKCIEIKSNWWRKFRGGVNAYGVYRLSSNYGTSYVQAFIVFIILILLLAALFLYSGFYINVEKSAGEVRAVEYNVLPDSEHQTGTLSQWAYDYLSAVSLSISIVTFQKERFYQPMGGVSRFLFYIALVVLTAQATLILLAIRRRFKR